MLRKCVIGLAAVSLVVAAVSAFRGPTNAQPRNELPAAPAQHDPAPPPNGPTVKQASPLPVKQVVLFNSGVGYFQREGEVEGTARVDLQFPATDINDLIKSLVLEDKNGKVMPLRYDSQEPVEKTLRSFAIDLSSNPSFGQIINQARGEKIEITLAQNNNGLPNTMTGAIVGMETQHRPGAAPGTPAGEMEVLNILCAEGMRSVPLQQVQRLRFLNPTLESELRRALEVVAVAHDAQKRAVRLGFKGEGKRSVRVGYVVENPIWKTSYRLVLDKDGKPRLKAFATIENTSDEDWNEVKLTLVSARPISFQMDMYPPLYIPRPLVEPEVFASLRPPTYGGPLVGMMGMQGGAGFGGFNGFGGGNVGMNNTMQQLPAQGFNQLGLGMPMGQGQMGAQFGNLGGQFGQFGLQGFANNSVNFNRYQNFNFNPIANQKLTYQDWQNRRNANNDPNNPNGKDQQQQAKQQAQKLGNLLTSVDPELVESALTAEELGNPARFVIEEKVSLPRQQSAMLPLFDLPVEAKRVTIYNERVHAKHPLFGLKVKNTTKQALMQGPIAVYEGGQYAGDARVLDLQPGEERFVSYAIDTGTEIKPFDKVEPGPELTARMVNNRLQVQYKLRQTRTYVIVNRSPEARQMVIEQPVREGWKLVVPDKPAERTRDLYRFNVAVKPGETVKYEVSEELPRLDPFESTKHADWTGFATSLGMDVWTDSKRTPEDSFGVEVVKNALQVTHKDRRTQTYFLRNRDKRERTVWLEHAVPAERRLVGDAQPVADNARLYRFKLTLPAGKTVSHSVTDELIEPRPESFALVTVEGTPPPRPGTNDLPQQRYVTELGVEVWAERKAQPESLVSVKFAKGEVRSVSKQREAILYHVRNRSEQERTFVLDHLVRPEWSFVGESKPVEGAGLRYRFPLKAAPGQIAKQAVSEEHLVSKTQPLGSFDEARVKEVLASDAASAAVKEALKKGVAMQAQLAQTQSTLKELRAQVKEINDEQARLRTNMEKLPNDSPLYKRYLTKLDEQETALEKVQSQVVQRTNAEKQQKQELESFLKDLNVD